MKIAFLQVAGGIGAQVIGLLALDSLESKGFFVFKDGRYFSDKGRKYIPEDLSLFSKSLSDESLHFNFFEKTNLTVLLVKYILKILKLFFPKNIFFFGDFPKNLKQVEASNYLRDQVSDMTLTKIKKEISYSNKKIFPEYICVHLRRGDYLQTDLEILRFPEMIEELKKINDPRENLPIVIVTDSPELIKDEKEKFNLDCIIQSSSPTEDLNIMINSDYFIASCSQLSLISIWLSQSMKKISCPISLKDVVNNLKGIEIFWR